MVALCDPALELHAVQREVERLVARGRGTAEAASDDRTGRMLTVPCAFDGPDLAEVAAAAGCAPSEVVRLLTEGPLSVAVMGFAPGFAYLDGLPEPLRGVPRRATPRPVVPAGSVALANGYAAVYPTASPGGWQLVGRTGTPSSPRRSRPTPPWRRATGSGSSRRPPTTPWSRHPASRPPGRRRRGAASVLEVEARGCAPCCRTVAGAAWRPSASPPPVRPIRCRSRWPTGWWAIGPGRRRARDHGRRRLGCAASSRATSPWWAGRPTSAWTAVPNPPGQVVPLAPGQLLEIGPMRAGPARVRRRGRRAARAGGLREPAPATS